MKKELTVEAGKTYWGFLRDHTDLKSCKLVQRIPDWDGFIIRTRHPNCCSAAYTVSSCIIRSIYPFATEKAARKALVRSLEKDADKAFTVWNKLMNRLRKAKESLATLS